MHSHFNLTFSLFLEVSITYLALSFDFNSSSENKHNTMALHNIIGGGVENATEVR